MNCKEGLNTTEQRNAKTVKELGDLNNEIKQGGQPEDEIKGDASSLDLQEGSRTLE